ncbi:hypothetical protein Tco_1319668 [Tanacetum coccineum]
MANLSNYGSDVLSEVPHSETYQNDMANQSVQAMQNFEQTPVVDFPTRSCLKLKRKLKLENERLLEHIICQDVVTIVMHADVKFDNVLHVPNTFLDDNIALDVMKMENDRLMYLLVSQDLVHTDVNSLATINDYKSIGKKKSYIEEYEWNLKLAAELLQMNEAFKNIV